MITMKNEVFVGLEYELWGGGGLSFGGGRKTFRDKKSTGVGDFFSWGKKGGGLAPSHWAGKTLVGGGSNTTFWGKNPQVYLIIIREWITYPPRPPHFKSWQFSRWCILFNPLQLSTRVLKQLKTVTTNGSHLPSRLSSGKLNFNNG